MQLPDIKAVSFARAEVKTTMAASPGRGHDTHRRLQWQSALFFFHFGCFIGCERRRIASRGSDEYKFEVLAFLPRNCRRPPHVTSMTTGRVRKRPP